MEPHLPQKAIVAPVVLRFGDFELDLRDESLRRNGERIYIKRRMFQVLWLLAVRQGEIVSKEDFFSEVWSDSFVEDNNLTVAIAALRKVLGDTARQARFIENIPRKGYRFIAPVDRVQYEDSAYVMSDRTVVEIAPKAERSLGPGSGQRFFRPTGHLKLYIGLLAVFIVLIVSFAVVKARINWPFGARPVDRIDSVVVLPFEDLTADSEYLADGLTDGISNDLSRLSRIRVIDRNSAYQYKNKLSDPLAAGRELGVRSVVTGQIEHNGAVLIITASLFDLASNTQVWRQQFRRNGSDLFATQIEISQAIAQYVLSDQTGVEKSRLSKRQTEDPKAYDLYLKGRYYWNKRTNPDIHRSAELFKAAIDQDPTFAQAYIGLANAYTLGDFLKQNLSLEEKNAMIRGLIQKALEIDDSLGEAYAALAINKCYYDWDLPAAESDYRRALELSPNDATAHHWYAEFLSMQGRFDESIAEYDRAVSLDPLSLPIRTDKAFSYYYARDYDTAIELLNKVKELNPDYERTYEFLGFIYREKGMFDDSADAMLKKHTLLFQRGATNAASFNKAKLYTEELRAGAKNAGAEGYWKAELKYGDPYGDPAPFYKAVAYSKLGETDKSLEYLERSFASHYSGMVWLKVTPELDGLRADPRYQDLLRRVGFRSG